MFASASVSAISLQCRTSAGSGGPYTFEVTTLNIASIEDANADQYFYPTPPTVSSEHVHVEWSLLLAERMHVLSMMEESLLLSPGSGVTSTVWSVIGIVLSGV